MYTYFKIQNNTTNIIEVIETIKPLSSYITKEIAAITNYDFLVPVEVTEATLNPSIQVLNDPIDTYDGILATRVFTTRSKTQQKLDYDAQIKDIGLIKDKGKDLALLIIEFIDWALANTAMTATDFTPDVRQAYQNIKIIANRIKGI